MAIGKTTDIAPARSGVDSGVEGVRSYYNETISVNNRSMPSIFEAIAKGIRGYETPGFESRISAQSCFDNFVDIEVRVYMRALATEENKAAEKHVSEMTDLIIESLTGSKAPASPSSMLRKTSNFTSSIVAKGGASFDEHYLLHPMSIRRLHVG